MKRNILLIILGFISINAYSQQWWGAILIDTLITFDNKKQEVTIDTSNHQNIWQIGRPKKVFFDSAYSRPNAIVTDTVGFYPPDNLSSFSIEEKCDNKYFCGWGGAKLSFWHKYDTDTLYDGGYVEIQYDTSMTWTNVISDSELTHNQNFYNNTDTILGNTPAFSGKSNGWVYSEYDWSWLVVCKKYGSHNDVKIRFVFQSSSKNANREGWMIDNIEFTIYQVAGGVNELSNENGELKIYPNPANDVVTIYFQGYRGKEWRIENGELRIYSIIGELIRTLPIQSALTEVNISDLAKGIYIVKVVNDNGVAVKRVVKD